MKKACEACDGSGQFSFFQGGKQVSHVLGRVPGLCGGLGFILEPDEKK